MGDNITDVLLTTTLAGAGNSDDDDYKKCITRNRDYTDIYRQDFGGIPQTFALNVAAIIIIFFIFSFLRKGVGSYARLGVVLRHRIPNMLTTFGDRVTGHTGSRNSYVVNQDPTSPGGASISGMEDDLEAVHVEVSSLGRTRGGSNHVPYQQLDPQTGQPVHKNSGAISRNDTMASTFNGTTITSKSIEDLEMRKERIAAEDEKHLFRWIWLTWSLTIEDFRHKVNEDAVQYLHFQRSIMFIMAFNCLCCLLVILPVNLLGGEKIDHGKDIGRTTINNLQPKSNLLYIHSIYAVIMVIFVFIVVARFERKHVRATHERSTAVMVENFPIKKLLDRFGSHEDLLKRLEKYFVKGFGMLPGDFQIFLVYDVRRLQKLLKEFNKYTECLDYLERKKQALRAEIIASSHDLTALDEPGGGGHEELGGFGGHANNGYIPPMTNNNSSEAVGGISIVDTDEPHSVRWDMGDCSPLEQPAAAENGGLSPAMLSASKKRNRQPSQIMGDKFRDLQERFKNLDQLNFNKNCLGFICCCCYEKRNAQIYYQRKREQIIQKMNDQIADPDSNYACKPLPLLYVRLQSHEKAQMVKSYWPIDGEVLSSHWEIKIAPPVDDIIWENLSIRGLNYRVRWLIAMVLFLLLFVFVSTPAVFVSLLNIANAETKWLDYIHDIPFMNMFTAPLIFVILAALLPFIVILITDIQGFNRKSQYNYSNFIRVYIYLLCMILILPSIGLKTQVDLLNLLKQPDSMKVDCIFMPDNASFFVNYIISTSMLGLMGELLRVADMLWYIIMLILMKSKAERKYVKKLSVLEFPYGYCYAFQLLAISIVIVYSPICPIIAPFGVLYSFTRHYIDRYNLYFSFEPSKLNKDIHKSSTAILLLAGSLSLLTLCMFSWFKASSDHPNTIFLCLSLICILIIIGVRKFTATIKQLSAGIINTTISIGGGGCLDQTDSAAPPPPDSGTLPKPSSKPGSSGSSAGGGGSAHAPGGGIELGIPVINSLKKKESQRESLVANDQMEDTSCLETSHNGHLQSSHGVDACDAGGDLGVGSNSFLNISTTTSTTASNNQALSQSYNMLDRMARHAPGTPVSVQPKYVPPVFHLMLNNPEIATPKSEIWYSQGPEPGGYLHTEGRRARGHKRTASDGNVLNHGHASKRAEEGREKAAMRSAAKLRRSQTSAGTSGVNNVNSTPNGALVLT